MIKQLNDARIVRKQVHSDIYYDLFQLKLCKDSNIASNYFKLIIYCTGLPYKTKKMYLTFNIFIMDDNKGKIRIHN